jgi:hypothetical protein
MEKYKIKHVIRDKLCRVKDGLFQDCDTIYNLITTFKKFSRKDEI